MGYILKCLMRWCIDVPGPDGFETVKISGDFDLYHAPAFAAAMVAHLAKGARKVRIDLSEVGYLDSSGVGAIIRIVQTARAGATELRFVGITGSPRKVLRLSNILPLLREEQGAEPV